MNPHARLAEGQNHARVFAFVNMAFSQTLSRGGCSRGDAPGYDEGGLRPNKFRREKGRTTH